MSKVTSGTTIGPTFRAWVQPRTNLKISPYKLMFGKPYQISTFPGSMEQTGKQEINEYLISLGQVLNQLKKTKLKNEYVILSEPLTLDTPAHRHLPGGSVYVKAWSSEPSQDKWKLQDLGN